MRWDGDEMGEARGLRRALLHCTALTPFFLSLDRPTSSSDPTQLSHTHNTPFRRMLGSPTLVTHPSQHSCHVPFPTLYFPFCPLFKNTREILSFLYSTTWEISISDHRISICLSLFLDPIHGM